MKHKNIFAIPFVVIMAFILVVMNSCNDNDEHDQNLSYSKIGKQPIYLDSALVNGHTYLMLSLNSIISVESKYMNGFVHSRDCPCIKAEKDSIVKLSEPNYCEYHIIADPEGYTLYDAKENRRVGRLKWEQTPMLSDLIDRDNNDRNPAYDSTEFYKPVDYAK